MNKIKQIKIVLIRIIKLWFYDKCDKKQYPLVCTKCGNNTFKEEPIDWINFLVVEAEVVCTNCDSVQAIYGFGFYDHVTKNN